MENKTNSSNRIVIGVLLALLIGALGYTLYTNSKLNESKAFLEDEKVKIGQDLDEMIAKYDKAISENSALADELKLEREDILLFRDSVKNLKQTNYSIISRYRKKIASLEASNQDLFQQNDSLRISNQFLAGEIDSARVFIQNQTALLDTLTMKNTELANKIGIGAKLLVNSVKAVSMKQRNNGKLVSTSRANRTDALRISFRIAENSLADESKNNALIQVLSPSGDVIHNIGSEILENGEEIAYTDKTDVEYNKEDIDVISLIEVDRKTMSKGIHSVNVFLDGRFVGTSKFDLK
ncbi:hypothetical protein [Urechidicola croceus]|uniref:Chromosome partitioning protein ParA n=1 Tax=Urechidicola croceus TaxID=1850246 RepID=A0A1D8PA51_9FLAO|nr:hypothetical protein [Urechidicola croceus]AOW21391.1 hypothetical protein LPB138_12195 [Urechidicola croceus]